MKLNKCCFCIELRIGAIIIAILQILECVGQTAGLLLFLKKEFNIGIAESFKFGVIPSCIPSLHAGIFLLYGAIRYKADATLLYLIIKAILAILSIGMGIVLFVLFSNGYLPFSGEHQEMGTNLMIGGAIALILHAILDVYFWICVFNLYSKMKSRKDSSNA